MTDERPVFLSMHPATEERHRVSELLEGYLDTFMETCPQRPVYTPGHSTHKDVFHFHDEPTDVKRTLALLEEHVDTFGLQHASGRNFSYIPGGGTYASALAGLIAGVTNHFVGHPSPSPVASSIENAVLKWMGHIVGYTGPHFAGDLTSGGSIANLIALLSARDSFNIPMADMSRYVVYMSKHTHYSLRKALHVLGMDGCPLHQPESDHHYSMKAPDLERMILEDKKKGLIPWCVISNAGSTDTGSVDPLDDIGTLARHHEMWHHVDGAYGASFSLTDQGSRLLKGLSNSNSLVLDPHKGLFCPLGHGAVLFRDKDQIASSLALQTYSEDAKYFSDTDFLRTESSHSAPSRSLELGRPFRGLTLWLSLKLLGVGRIEQALQEKLDLARYFFEEVQTIPGMEVFFPPHLSIVVFRAVAKNGESDALNKKLLQEIKGDGRIFLSPTQIEGKFSLRLAILSFNSSREDVECALEVIKEKRALYP